MAKKSKSTKRIEKNGRYTPPKRQPQNQVRQTPEGTGGISVTGGVIIEDVRLVGLDYGIHVGAGKAILNDLDLVNNKIGIIQTGGEIDANNVTIHKTTE